MADQVVTIGIEGWSSDYSNCPLNDTGVLRTGIVLPDGGIQKREDIAGTGSKSLFLRVAASDLTDHKKILGTNAAVPVLLTATGDPAGGPSLELVGDWATDAGALDGVNVDSAKLTWTLFAHAAAPANPGSQILKIIGTIRKRTAAGVLSVLSIIEQSITLVPTIYSIEHKLSGFFGTNDRLLIRLEAYQEILE